MKIKVEDFVAEFIEKKVMNTKATPDAVEKFIRSKLEIVDYLPFAEKLKTVKMVVAQCVDEEDGVKKVDSITQYLAFIISMLEVHTNLEFGNPMDDYDGLNRCRLLEPIVSMFQQDYSECEVLLKMAIADELADNNLNVIVGKFLNGILTKIDGFGEVVKGFTENIDLSKLLGTNIKEEDVTKIIGLINKLNK